MSCSLCGNGRARFLQFDECSLVERRFYICKFCEKKMNDLIIELRQSSKGLSSIELFQMLQLEFRSSWAWRIFNIFAEKLTKEEIESFNREKEELSNKYPYKDPYTVRITS